MSTGQVGAWLTRADLAAGRGSSAEGLVLLSGEGEVAVGVSAGVAAAGAAASRDTLRSVGIGPNDRVLVALNNDGELCGAILAQAIMSLVQAVASTGPRGRMRILRALESFAPTVLVTTPAGASDLLSRIHIEFLLDPLDFGLRKLIVIGEIPSEEQLAHLAAEFGAAVHEVYADPYYGVLLAHRTPGERHQTVITQGVLGLGSLDSDAPAPASAAYAELLIRPAALGGPDIVLRSGQVVLSEDGAASPAMVGLWRHTVGEHLLVRGRWVSVPLIRRALVKIDGIRGWSLQVSREGTLDNARLVVGLERTLADSAVWVGRIQEAMRAVSPVRVEVTPVDARAWDEKDELVDHRGHHLGLSRR
jgi:phenylacetate-CoA ligase